MLMRKSFPLLPPPAETILLYAADGLSVWKKNFSPSGNPRTPERTVWVPMFNELVKSPEGLRTLHKLAEIGMKAWQCPPATVDCLKDAFHDITLRGLFIVNLQRLADTSRERITLPPLPNPPSPSSPPKKAPRPERSQQANRAEPPPQLASPRRPPQRPGGVDLNLG